jgi:transposase
MERRWQHTTRALTDDLQISTAMADAMVSNKTRVAGLGVVGLFKGSARIAYLTKAQIQFKLLAIGMITASPTGKKPKAYLGISKTSITEERLFRFLTEYRKHEKRKLILLLDRLPAHKSKKMKTFVEHERDWLTLEYFPSYVPELDPVEYPWSSAKQKDFADLCPDRVEYLERRLRRSARRYKNNPEVLRGFLEKSRLFPKKL